MRHFASAEFWEAYSALPARAWAQADKAYARLKADPAHPSVRLKKVDPYWSARVSARYRALAVEVPEGLLWFWIGTHADYDRLLS